MSNKVKIQTTQDGSPTLYSSTYDQTYHNPGGAVAESRHVFFERSGLEDQLKQDDPITILEVGFGTGLNLLLTMDRHLAHGERQPIHFHSVEQDPIQTNIARELDFTPFLEHGTALDLLPGIFENLHDGYNKFSFWDQFDFTLFKGAFEDYHPDKLKADFIFHDAFSPDVNPELWTGETFEKLASLCSRKAVLTTYCAASAARGAMCWAGWTVARAPGALGKREMTVASLDASKIEAMGLEQVNNERLAHRYEIEDFD